MNAPTTSVRVRACVRVRVRMSHSDAAASVFVLCVCVCQSVMRHWHTVCGTKGQRLLCKTWNHYTTDLTGNSRCAVLHSPLGGGGAVATHNLRGQAGEPTHNDETTKCQHSKVGCTSPNEKTAHALLLQFL